MIRVALVDDHAIVRQGLRALLEAQPDISVIGEASDGMEAITMAERLLPDVVIMDAAMPGMNGIEATSQLKARLPAVCVLILSMHGDVSYVLRALKNGADGYILKHETADALVQAIRQALSGHRYLSPPLSEKVVEEYIRKTQSGELNEADLLTAREREVLQLAAEGYSNVAIADRFSISARTAETHRTNLMRKLGLRSQTELVLYSIRNGIIELI